MSAIARVIEKAFRAGAFERGAFVALAALGFTACSEQGEAPAVTERSGAAAPAFRSSVWEPPAGWRGPTFELSHAYPETLPPSCGERSDAPWLGVAVDFDAKAPTWEGGWDDYMTAILDYIKEEQDLRLADQAGWKAEVGGKTRWYHVPWMAFDEHSGREFVHGLTNELSVHLSMFEEPGRGSGSHHLPLATGGTGPLFETWAFGVYNECGGHAIGQTWSSGAPSMTTVGGKQRSKGLPFQPGTLVVKFLFSSATPAEVDYLEGSPAWQANRHVQRGADFDSCEREVQRVHLVQADVAVVDHRSPTHWVYGTFVYNGTLPGDTLWERFSPLGVQWGSDSKSFPAVPKAASAPVRESVLGPIDLYEHEGCNGRLAGPVDEAESACLTCHMGAFTANVGGLSEMGKDIPAIFEFDGICYTHNEANEYYFSNYRYPDQYPSGEFPDAVPLDSSLQLWVAFSQYGQWNTTGKSASCKN